MRRLFTFAAAFALAGTLAAPSTTYAQQSVNFLLGGFVPKGEDGRDRNDVLRRNLNAGADSLVFDINDFAGGFAGVEWLFPLGEVFEGGLGIGLYSRSVPSVYRDFVNSNGDEIEQDLQLRVVPFTATVRWLPLGRHDAFTPYLGAGVNVLRFRYRETGQFVDVNDDIFEDTFTSTGAASGPVILGGARFPVGSVDLGGEVRWQGGTGDLDNDDFLGTEIDLGGFSYLFTINVKF
ncbi:MAG: hypothetical protein AB7O32_02270 [Vicinamibacterales bacterium]